MNEETIRFLIEQKITYVNTAANACMLWWVSSLVFCGSVLGAMWLRQDELKKHRFVNWLGLILSVFFFAIVVFGGSVIYYLYNGQREIAALAAKLGYEGDFFSTELSSFRLSMWFGTGSFFLVSVVWVFFWIDLRSKTAAEQANAPDRRHESSKVPTEGLGGG